MREDKTPTTIGVLVGIRKFRKSHQIYKRIEGKYMGFALSLQLVWLELQEF